MQAYMNLKYVQNVFEGIKIEKKRHSKGVESEKSIGML